MEKQILFDNMLKYETDPAKNKITIFGFYMILFQIFYVCFARLLFTQNTETTLKTLKFVLFF